MANSSIKKGVDPSGTAVATESFTEGAETRHVQRIRIDGTNGLSVTDALSASTPDGAVSVTTSSTLLLAANTARVGFTINNTGGAIIYVRLAATGATVAASIRLTPGSFWGMQGPGVYRGALCAITSSGTGDTRCAEW